MALGIARLGHCRRIPRIWTSSVLGATSRPSHRYAARADLGQAVVRPAGGDHRRHTPELPNASTPVGWLLSESCSFRAGLSLVALGPRPAGLARQDRSNHRDSGTRPP